MPETIRGHVNRRNHHLRSSNEPHRDGWRALRAQ